MRVLLQRVTRASVVIGGEVRGEIGPGLLILVGAGPRDDAARIAKMAEKCVNLRIFSDADDKFNHSALELGRELLVVSQFTLYADARRGRRPSFTGAAAPVLARELYEQFVMALRASGLKVATGEFGASMQVSLINDGPVTIWLDDDEGAPAGVVAKG